MYLVLRVDTPDMGTVAKVAVKTSSGMTERVDITTIVGFGQSFVYSNNGQIGQS